MIVRLQLYVRPTLGLAYTSPVLELLNASHGIPQWAEFPRYISGTDM